MKECGLGTFPKSTRYGSSLLSHAPSLLLSVYFQLEGFKYFQFMYMFLKLKQILKMNQMIHLSYPQPMPYCVNKLRNNYKTHLNSTLISHVYFMAVHSRSIFLIFYPQIEVFKYKKHNRYFIQWVDVQWRSY